MARGFAAAMICVAMAIGACAPMVPLPDAGAPTLAAAPRAEPTGPSEASEALALYYRRLENDLLARGLMRKDGGGPDTPFNADDLVRNFETITFFDEYRANAGLSARDPGSSGRLRKWRVPVRISVGFGDFVTEERRARDLDEVSRYTARLARVTGHPITVGTGAGNFHVLFMGLDDREKLERRLRTAVPGIDDTTLRIFTDLPRNVHCLVVAFSDAAVPQEYTKAIALVRAEHPDLLRRSCIHEELAQGLGLANDSPDARPSIFNDDDEFALLTTHDEFLLRILYDPRLRIGMTAAEARPTVRAIAEGLTGPNT